MEQQQILDLIGQADALYNEEKYIEALAIYQTLADEQVIYAFRMLGIIYDNGFGTDANPAEAFKYYRLGSENGETDCTNNLGLMYEQGKGVKQNHYEAARCYQEAAAAGNAISMNNYANMLYNGRGVRKNIPEARRYYQQAAELGYEDAQQSLNAIEAKYEFAPDGTIAMEGKKRSKWVVAILHLFFWNSLMPLMMEFAPTEEEPTTFASVVGTIALIVFIITNFLILCKVKLGGKLLTGLVLFLPIGIIVSFLGDFTSLGVAIYASILLIVLQIKRNGIPAWNLLMRIPYDGRNTFVKLFDFATVYGKGDAFRADSPQTEACRKQIKIAAVVVGISAIAAVCLMFIHSTSINFTPNWNFFKSVLAFPLWIVGFLLSLKYRVASLVFGYKGPDNTFKPSNDIVDNMFGSIIYPLLMRFIVFPLIFALPIFYAIMAVVAVLGAIFPYVLALAMIGSPVLYYLKANDTLIGRQYRKVLIPAFAALFIFVYLIIYVGWTAEAEEVAETDHIESVYNNDSLEN